MCHSSVNTCQNQVKLCTLKVQDKCNWQYQSLACQLKIVSPTPFFNDKGPGTENIILMAKILKLLREIMF